MLDNKTTTTATTAPKRPCMSPSSMNGIRMNQFVAPTSFITPTSRRRAKIAIRIAFRISTSDETSSTIAITSKMICKTLVTCCITLMLWPG